jgi:hypothetical protein
MHCIFHDVLFYIHQFDRPNYNINFAFVAIPTRDMICFFGQLVLYIAQVLFPSCAASYSLQVAAN